MRYAAAVAGLVAMLGCDDSTGLSRDDVAGEYSLTLWNGEAVPGSVPAPLGGGTMYVDSGSLALNTDGTFRIRWEVSDAVFPVTIVEGGWWISGHSIIWTGDENVPEDGFFTGTKGERAVIAIWNRPTLSRQTLVFQNRPALTSLRQ